jgi:superkiller protein 3
MVREAPRAPSAYAGLAGAVQSASADSAIKLYNRALFFDQRYLPAHINLGIIYSQRGDHRRAIHQLRLAKELQPSSPAVQTNLGLAYLNAAELDSALAAFDRATRFDNSLGQPHLGRALALTFAGRSEDAAAALRAALSRDPGLLRDVQDLGRSLVSNPGQRLGTPVGINRLGSLLTAAGDTALAETCYSRSLDLDPTCVPALYNSAVLSVLRGDSARARTLAARALRLRPDLIAVRQLCESLAR